MFYDHLNRKYWNPLYRGLTHDPEAKHLYQMGQAVWLYIYLLIEANENTGRLTSSFGRMSQEMGIAEATLMSWLGQLRKHNYLSTRPEGDALQIKIAKWRQVPGLADADHSGDGQRRKPNKSTESANKRNKAMTALARELAKSLDDLENLDAYQQLCRRYSENILKRARDQVLAIPDDKIRKSRGALFTYLIKNNGMEK